MVCRFALSEILVNLETLLRRFFKQQDYLFSALGDGGWQSTYESLNITFILRRASISCFSVFAWEEESAGSFNNLNKTQSQPKSKATTGISHKPRNYTECARKSMPCNSYLCQKEIYVTDSCQKNMISLVTCWGSQSPTIASFVLYLPRGSE